MEMSLQKISDDLSNVIPRSPLTAINLLSNVKDAVRPRIEGKLKRGSGTANEAQPVSFQSFIILSFDTS